MGLSVMSENNNAQQECKLTCDYHLLKNSPIFEDADKEVVKLFAYLVTRKSFKAGDTIISSGTPADAAIYLISGKAEITTMHHRQEIFLQQLTPGMLCGELALLAGFKWFFNARATEVCEIFIISRKSFQKVLQAFPDKRDKMIEKIVQLRIERLVEQTTFMLDNIPEPHLSTSIWSPSKLSI